MKPIRYTVRVKPAAERSISKLSRDIQARILAKLDQLAMNPFAPGCEKLHGEAGYRTRVGAYRIVYDVEQEELMVLVVRVGHRREIYR